MGKLSQSLKTLQERCDIDKTNMINDIVNSADVAGYVVADIDSARPWGGFVRFDYQDGDRFVNEFFAGLNPDDARLGIANAELSPKILLVAPKQRLSWQKHERRAERWKFLTDGAYYKSFNESDQGEIVIAKSGDEVQFATGECHRLVGADDNFTVVAEIWQHTDPDNLSNEDDIIRLQDDYSR